MNKTLQTHTIPTYLPVPACTGRAGSWCCCGWPAALREFRAPRPDRWADQGPQSWSLYQGPHTGQAAGYTSTARTGRKDLGNEPKTTCNGVHLQTSVHVDWPWLERGSSGPGWHSAGKLVHSKAGSHSAVLWPLKTDTTRKSDILKTFLSLKYEYHAIQKGRTSLPPTRGTDPCLHLLTHSTSESEGAWAFGCIPVKKRKKKVTFN